MQPPRLPASVLGSVAVLAIGTSLEWLARRMAGSAAKAAGRALIRPARSLNPIAGRSSDTDVTVDEILYIRKVHLRR